MLVLSVSSAWAWLVFSVLADPNTITTLASPQENLNFQGRIFPFFSLGLLRAKFGTCSSRLNFLGLSLVTAGAGHNPFPELGVPARGSGGTARSGELADERGVRGFALFPQSPPTTAAAPQPASPPASGVAELRNGCGWQIQMWPSCVPVAALRDAASVRRRPPSAVGFVRPLLRPAPPRASPPPPRSHFLGAGGGSAPGSEGLSRRA